MAGFIILSMEKQTLKMLNKIILSHILLFTLYHTITLLSQQILIFVLGCIVRVYDLNTLVCTCKHIGHGRVTWCSGHHFALGLLQLCIPL